MKRMFIDTNLIVRYLAQDHEKHAKAAGKLFDACDKGELVIVLLPAVLAECVFVLEFFYKHSRGGGVGLKATVKIRKLFIPLKRKNAKRRIFA